MLKQKKHWESVQGELNALKLSLHEYLIPYVGYHFAPNFTRI